MKKRFKILTYCFFVLSGFSLILYAQSPETLKDGSPEAQKPEEQLDFWIGEWNLEWDKGGKGKNIITKTLDNRVIMENFDGTPSTKLKGISVSTYNSKTGKWHQTWVDNQGSYLDFTGGYKDGRMILQRKAEVNGKEILQRMVFYNIAKDKLEWNWERSQDKGKSWEVMWNIHYTRKQTE